MTGFDLTDPDEGIGYPLATIEELDSDDVPTIGRDDADRMLRTLAYLDAENTRIGNDAGRELERIRQWRDRRQTIVARQRVWFEQALEQWTRAEHARTGTLTFNLPNGKVTLRKRTARVVVTDEAAAVAKLGDHHPAVKVARSVLLGEAKKNLAVGPASWEVENEPGMEAHALIDPATGEFIPGVYIFVASSAAADRKFSATPSDGVVDAEIVDDDEAAS
jgi:hypothetical protein